MRQDQGNQGNRENRNGLLHRMLRRGLLGAVGAIGILGIGVVGGNRLLAQSSPSPTPLGRDIQVTWTPTDDGAKIEISTGNLEIGGYVVIPTILTTKGAPAMRSPHMWVWRVDGNGGVAGKTAVVVWYKKGEEKLLGVQVVGVQLREVGGVRGEE